MRTDANSVFYFVLLRIYFVLEPLWDHYVEVYTMMEFVI